MWIIQSNFLDINQITPIVETLRANDIPFRDVGIIPFSDEFITPLDVSDTNLIPYGSTKLSKIAEQQKWSGLFFDRTTFRNDVWNWHRGDMLNSDAKFMTVREAINEFANAEPDSVWFIRPVEDLKHFSGTVTTAAEIARWMSSVDVGNFSFDENVEVAISTPKNILMEWRYFIVGGKIVTGSLYRVKGMRKIARENDPAVLAEAQDRAKDWLPHETCVMDMALTDDGLRVVEFNCLNSSGFYDHDIEKFVLSVSDYFYNKTLR